MSAEGVALAEAEPKELTQLFASLVVDPGRHTRPQIVVVSDFLAAVEDSFCVAGVRHSLVQNSNLN